LLGVDGTATARRRLLPPQVRAHVREAGERSPVAGELSVQRELSPRAWSPAVGVLTRLGAIPTLRPG